MATIEQFVAPSNALNFPQHDELVEAVMKVHPDLDEESADVLVVQFCELRRRVDNPSRRTGAPYVRCGRVLFPSIHHATRVVDEEETP